MDWAKAKTILIVVFLAIDIFLGYVILGDSQGTAGHVDSESLKRVTDYLTEKGISVRGEIPGRKMDMASISVKYKLFNKDSITASLFSGGGKVTETVEDSNVRLESGAVTVNIKDNRELAYTDSSIGPSEEMDEKDCSKKIRKLLTSLGIKDDAGIRRVEKAGGYMRFVYSQTFKGAQIYNSEMEFYVNASGIHEARIVWFETVRPIGKRTGVISPVIALLYVPEHNNNNPFPSKEVLEVQQGYYFGTGVNEQVDTSVVEGGTALPVWKITTERDIFYINAYNEKVEGVEKAKK